MPTDLTVILRDTPGELARLGEVTGAAGVNIRGLAAFTGEGRGVIHLLVDDEVVERARGAEARSHRARGRARGAGGGHPGSAGEPRRAGARAVRGQRQHRP